MINIRNRSIYRGVYSSILSKGVGFVYQLVSLPILLNYLGQNNFGFLAILMSIVGWVNLLNSGVSPYITRVISAEQSPATISMVVAASQKIVIALSCILIFIFLGIVIFLNKELSLQDYSIVAVFIFSIIIVNLGLADSVRQGRHEQYINNILIMLASFITVTLIYLISDNNIVFIDHVFTAVLVIYFPLLLTKVYNFASLRKEYFEFSNLVRIKPKAIIYKLVFSVLWANLFIQLSVILVKSFSLLLLGMNDLSESARLEIVFRYLLILGTIFATVQPIIWPLITQAKKVGDKDWLFKIKIVIASSFFIIGLLNYFLSYTYGQNLFYLWLGDSEVLTVTEINYSALYFFMISLAQAPIVILMGKGEFSLIGKVLFMESILYVFISLSIFFVYKHFALIDALVPMVVCRFIVFLLLVKPAYYE